MVRENAGINNWIVQRTNRNAYYYWGRAMTAAVSNVNCERSCQPEQRWSYYNSLFDQSPFYTAALCRGIGITNANTILYNSTLTLSTILSIQIFLFDELEYFLIAFYLAISTENLSMIFNLRKEIQHHFIYWSLLWIISISIYLIKKDQVTCHTKSILDLKINIHFFSNPITTEDIIDFFIHVCIRVGSER